MCNKLGENVDGPFERNCSKGLANPPKLEGMERPGCPGSEAGLTLPGGIQTQVGGKPVARRRRLRI